MATALQWTTDLSVGIEIIDGQHKRIVEFINQLNQARESGDRKAVGKVLGGLADYTVSHFGFEEAAMDAAKFKGATKHRLGHEKFVRQLVEYGQRYALGEEVTSEVLDTLNKWLVNHIKRDDRDYMDAIKANLDGARLASILSECEAAQAKKRK